jgi:hypothetical protein
MTPDERREEIAAILARGVLRLRQAAQSSPVSGGSRSSRTPDMPTKQRHNGLDEGTRTSPHVPARQPRARHERSSKNTSVNIAKEVADLGGMTVKDLGAKHIAVFGEAARSFNRQHPVAGP